MSVSFRRGGGGPYADDRGTATGRGSMTSAVMAPGYSGAVGSAMASLHTANCRSSTGFIPPWYISQ